VSDPTPTVEGPDLSPSVGDELEVSVVVCPDDENYVFVAGGPGRTLRCTAHLSDGSGRRCTQPAFANEHGPGKCIRHGVNAAVRAAARRRIEGAKMAGSVAVLAAEVAEQLGPDPSPHEILLEALRQARIRAALFEIYVGEQVQPWGADHLGDHRPTAAEEGLRHWSGEAARRAKMAIDAGVAEERVRLQGLVVDQLVAAMRVAIDAVVTALEAAAQAAGWDVGVLRAARAEAEADAFRRALAPLAALEVGSSERLPEAASSARDGQQSAT
jgi:hypothetical protein